MDGSLEEVKCDQLTIVNRSETYYVSRKKICSLVPYFEKMFCCDLMESKENKVTLDLDEDAFQSILSAVFTRSYILRIENVLQMSEVADYLLIDDFHDEFARFFRENFTIELIPNVLLAINEFSKLVNSRMVNAFIEAHFLKIVKVSQFLNYPVETVEHIFSLNLHIDSEYQVYEAIDQWINHDLETRKKYMKQLFKCIRWCHLEQFEIDEMMEDDFIQCLLELDTTCKPDSCKSDCVHKRSKSKSLIVVLEVETVGINLLIINENYSVISSDHFVQSDSLRPNIIADENITDIVYDSGRQGLCVDWKQKKYRHLKMSGSDNEYYSQLHRYIFHTGFLSDGNGEKLYLEREVTEVDSSESFESGSLIESGGQFHLVGYTSKKNLCIQSCVSEHSWFHASLTEPLLYACLDKNLIFIITKEGVHRLVDIDTYISTDIKLTDDQKFEFNNLQLTSLNSEFYLLDKVSKKIYILDVRSESWKELMRISSPFRVIALTSVYVSDETVKTLFKFS